MPLEPGESFIELHVTQGEVTATLTDKNHEPVTVRITPTNPVLLPASLPHPFATFRARGPAHLLVFTRPGPSKARPALRDEPVPDAPPPDQGGPDVQGTIRTFRHIGGMAMRPPEEPARTLRLASDPSPLRTILLAELADLATPSEGGVAVSRTGFIKA